MRKFTVAATMLAFALSAAPAVIQQAQAAPAKSPFCKGMASQKNLVSWAQYYKCWDTSPARVRLTAHVPAARNKSPFCAMGASQKNLVSWDQYYGCWRS